MIDEATVIEALRPVRDPELDESIVALDFVSSVTVTGDAVTVRLRLPTYFCAPNFSYMMVADVKEALVGLPGVGQTEVFLDDHFTSEEINEGVHEGKGFADTFPGLADEELGDLRALFRRKALMTRQYRLSRLLREQGLLPADMAVMTLEALPDGDEFDAYEAALDELGLEVDGDAPFLVDGAGRAISREDAEEHLARGRAITFSIELNAEFCSGVLGTRYPDARPSRKKEIV